METIHLLLKHTHTRHPRTRAGGTLFCPVIKQCRKSWLPQYPSLVLLSLLYLLVVVLLLLLMMMRLQEHQTPCYDAHARRKHKTTAVKASNAIQMLSHSFRSHHYCYLSECVHRKDHHHHYHRHNHLSVFFHHYFPHCQKDWHQGHPD